MTTKGIVSETYDFSGEVSFSSLFSEMQAGARRKYILTTILRCYDIPIKK